MTRLDWNILLLYLLSTIALSLYLGRRQKNEEDYYVGGRKLPWWAVGISTMATQTSAVSFISIPAFVALKEGGGLTWLQYELALPLAMIVLMAVLIPFFRELQLVSVYQYLELRFSPAMRSTLSLVFMVSRGLGTAVGVYASAIVLSVGLNIPLWLTILLIGAVTILYDTLGGMAAVVYSDVLQMAILLVGVITCITYAASSVGGLEEVWSLFPTERQQVLDFSMGIGDSSAAPLWPYLIGGFFLYLSYYGTDQSQVQRELSTPSVRDTRLSLLFNGLSRFPLTLLYVIMGVAIFAVYQQSPELQNAIPADNPDYLVPEFIVQMLPAGLRGLLFAALLAAAMSSLDSALNSLSAVTMRDFIEKRLPQRSQYFLLWSKLTTVAWGVAITGFAFVVGNISDTVLESINKVSSAFYGPILATFLVGILSRRVQANAMLAGCLSGVGFNLILWLGFPTVHWMWWNLVGCGVAIAIAFLLIRGNAIAPTITQYTLSSAQLQEQTRWLPAYCVLGGYFVVMLGTLSYFQWISG